MKKKDDLNTAINKAVIGTFSEMAFVDVISIDKKPDNFKYSQIIHLSFYKPEHGDVYMFMSYACKKLAVENIYTKDWSSLDECSIDDCFLELLNVLIGNFMNYYYGEKVKHNISFSEMVFDDTGIDNSNDFNDFYFNAEGHPFKVSISL